MELVDMEPGSQHGPGSFPSSESSLGHLRLLLLWEGAGGKERPCSITRLLRSDGFTEGHPGFCGVEAGIGLHEQPEAPSSGAGEVLAAPCWPNPALPPCLVSEITPVAS